MPCLNGYASHVKKRLFTLTNLDSCLEILELNDLTSLLVMLQLFAGEALFGHVELLKEGKLFVFPHLHSKGLL
jgi:hypothetical protein